MNDEDYELVIATNSDTDEEYEQVVPTQPCWSLFTIHLIRITKIITYIIFFVLFLKFTENVYSFNKNNFITMLFKTLWYTNEIIIFFNIVIIINEYLVDMNFFGRVSNFTTVNNVIKYISYITFYTSIILFVIVNLDGLVYLPKMPYYILLSYYGVEILSTFILLGIFLIMYKFGIGMNYTGLMISFWRQRIPFRTGASDKELEILKDYRVIKNENIIKIYDISCDKEMDGGQEECIICHTHYVNDDIIRYFECNHYYHKECCDEWLKISKTCPMCREVISFE